ncbi:MAG: cell division protein SepF [Candidatus Bathyarchaeota archaeon]|nr:cell division protein SepF [Candidatus Bathyarchaeota archaeon]
MSNIDLGRIIEKIIGKIKKKEAEPVDEAPLDTAPTSIAPASPAPSIPSEVYLKASALQSLEDLDKLKGEVESGNIMIIRVGPLAEKDVEDVKRAVGELCEFAERIGGDIARLGEERVVVTPSFVKIWREKAVESENETSNEA